MTKPDLEDRVREATRIFLRLRQNPDDASLLRARDAFLAEDDAEAIYAEVEKAWSLTAPPRRPITLSLLVLLTIMGASLYFAYAPLRVLVIADIRTDTSVLAATLDSGDRVVLDAASALSDNTSGVVRDVQLLEGAAYFDVTTREQAFVVQIGNLSVRVTGTAFETAFTDDTISIAVAEGQVEVSSAGQLWRLGPGDRLLWGPSKAATEQTLQPADIAAWRHTRLIIDGMTSPKSQMSLTVAFPDGSSFPTQRLHSRACLAGWI
ncbi:MAG: FecR domain-containing protein [Pseudomonadota bacterium]